MTRPALTHNGHRCRARRLDQRICSRSSGRKWKATRVVRLAFEEISRRAHSSRAQNQTRMSPRVGCAVLSDYLIYRRACVGFPLGRRVDAANCSIPAYCRGLRAHRWPPANSRVGDRRSDFDPAGRGRRSRRGKDRAPRSSRSSTRSSRSGPPSERSWKPPSARPACQSCRAPKRSLRTSTIF